MTAQEHISAPQPESRLDLPRKKRRGPAPCIPCRNRKLRCDREHPTCGRCIRSRTPMTCTYEDGFLWQQPETVDTFGYSSRKIALPPPPESVPRTASSPESASAPTPSQGPGGMSEARRTGPSRDRFLDTVLGTPLPTTPASQAESKAPVSWNSGISHRSVPETNNLRWLPQQLNLPNKMIVSGKETRTRYGGGGIIANLMLQFPECKPFMAELLSLNPIPEPVRADVEIVKKGHHKDKLRESIPIPDTASLVALVPPREMVERLVDVYLLHIESTHRVLHIPSFVKELSQFWRLAGEPAQISGSFVVQLLLVLSCAAVLFEARRGTNTEGLPFFKPLPVLEWILSCEKWLENSSMRKADITTLRNHSLLAIAENSQCVSRSRAWVHTGTLVKLAMQAGYHRDPERIPKVSTFNKEIRRRIWLTIVELDLQVALDKGMPPTLQASDFDTLAPSNINDEELHENTISLPSSKPLAEITDSSFQSVLAQSLPLRLRICKLMNSLRIMCCYEDIQEMERDLIFFRRAIPSWSTDENFPNPIGQKIALWKALLETKLNQALLAIHTPFAIEAAKDPIFAPSLRARLETAMLILSRQKLLHDLSIELSFCLLSDAAFQACLSILQHLYSMDAGYTSSTFHKVVPEITDSMLKLVDSTVSCMEGKVLLAVKGAKPYIFLHLILALVKSKVWPDETVTYKQNTLERITSVSSKILSHQRKVESMASGANHADESTSNNSSISVTTPLSSAFDGSWVDSTWNFLDLDDIFPGIGCGADWAS